MNESQPAEDPQARKPQTAEAKQRALDETMRRFEERMAASEEKTRPKRSRREVLDAAIDAVQTQLAKERGAMQQHFRMAAQEHAQRETVDSLEWLVVDLKRIRDEEV